MNDVKRYDCTNGKAQYCYGCYKMDEDADGDYVTFEDYAALRAQVSDLQSKLEEAELSKLDKECLRIGQQIQRAATELPKLWTLRIEVEKDAGTVELYDDQFDIVEFNDHSEGLSFSISSAIDAAMQQDSASS